MSCPSVAVDSSRSSFPSPTSCLGLSQLRFFERPKTFSYLIIKKFVPCSCRINFSSGLHHIWTCMPGSGIRDLSRVRIKAQARPIPLLLLSAILIGDTAHG